MRYCTKCGTPTSGEQTYCTKCGALLGQGTESETLARSPGVAPLPADTGTSPPADTGPPFPATTWPPTDTGTSPPSPSVSDPLPPRPLASRTTTVIVTLAAVAVLAAGGLVAWEFLGHRAAHRAAAPSVSAGRVDQAESGTGPAGSPTASTSFPAGSASQASPSPASQPAASSATVTVAPNAGQQPSAQQVAAFLKTYFTAIDTHDFGLYSSLLEPRLRPTLGQFNLGYRSTKDSGATLTGLSATATGLAATISFTSHQRPADSPTHTTCTAWDITLYLQPQASTYRIVSPPAGYHALYQSCS